MVHPLLRPRRALRSSIKMAREIRRLLRMWRLLVIREPPSDSDGERQRWINGQRVAPQYLWEVGCRVYQTAVIDCVRAWRMEAGWRAGDGKCGERPPVDGGRNPEGGVEALEPSHWRETPSTPIFRAFEALEVVEMLKRGVEQCYDENPAPGGSPLLLSRCNLAALLHDCAEEVSRGRAGWLPAESFQRMGEDRRPPTPSPPE